jgi:hypothetical protein
MAMVSAAPPVLDEVPPELVLRAMLAVDFRAFIEFTFGVLRPGTPFRPNWHIDAMAHELSQIASGELKRLIITLPPRNLKSICASVALPAWFLGHHPSERVVAVSYSDALAKTHANDFRKVVGDSLYQATFPAMQVSRDTDSEIHTTLRGRRYAKLLTVPEAERLASGRQFLSSENQTLLCEQATKSLQKEFPEDFVYDFVEPGPGDNFEFGINYKACGFCKFAARHGDQEILPNICGLDFDAYAREASTWNGHIGWRREPLQFPILATPVG